MLSEKKKSRKKRKAIVLFASFCGIFGLFVYLLMGASLKTEAIRSLASCNSKEEVKKLYQQYKIELFDNEDFLYEVRLRLTQLNLPDSSLMECQSWLPQPPTSLNVIIVPDLSRRIKDEENNEHQIENDRAIIKHLWEKFAAEVSLKKNSHDCFRITVTDPEQAQGQFDQVADNLFYDLSIHTNKTNRLYFTDYKKRKLLENTDHLYAMSVQNPTGANYVTFVRRYCEALLKKSDLFNHYKNKLIIITDGYLEKSRYVDFTNVRLGLTSKEVNRMTIPEITEVITNKGKNIAHVDVDLTETDVLICEVNERKNGRDFHYPILKAYWKDWFNRMNAKSVDFRQRNYSMNHTYQSLDKFMEK